MPCEPLGARFGAGGKVLYVGISDAPAWIVSQANTLADWRGWSPFVGLQIPYSLVERGPERDLLPMAKALDLTVASWGALGAGVLTGKFRGGAKPEGTRLTDTPWGKSNLTPRNLEIAEVACLVADELGCTPTQVAVAWVRQQGFGPIVPILGARTAGQLEDNLGALKITLDSAQLARLDEASRIERGFPHDFLDQVGWLVHGETRPLIDNHRA